jgi:hypothetical protein
MKLIIIFKSDLEKTKVFETLNRVQKSFFLKSSNVEIIQNAVNILANTGNMRSGMKPANEKATKELYENDYLKNTTI